MRSARLIFRRKRYYHDGGIAELVLWLAPEPVRSSAHGFRYRLFYGYPGDLVVLYDNEPGKGDHRHYGEREERYEFTTPNQLVRDFLEDVRTARRDRGQ
jgi:uncharacterized protein DUF6516